MPKLYVNTIYMVLNSRIRIIGGRDIYMSSTDMGITSTMIRDITESQPTEGARPKDGLQGRVSVVAITQEDFNDDHETGRKKVGHGNSRTLLRLIFPQGETTGQQCKPFCVTVRQYPSLTLHRVWEIRFRLFTVLSQTRIWMLRLICSRVFRSACICSYTKE